ncbi:hypothetical protein GCM10020218_011860 [Dactylosporangium vinaceum]
MVRGLVGLRERLGCAMWRGVRVVRESAGLRGRLTCSTWRRVQVVRELVRLCELVGLCEWLPCAVSLVLTAGVNRWEWVGELGHSPP